MSRSDRLERLEGRMEELERRLRRLERALRGEAEESVPPGTDGTSSPDRSEGASRPSATTSVPAEESAPSFRRSGEAAPSVGPDSDLEAWLGQKALLVVGLLALVAGVGYLLRHAFEQGWISPVMRVWGGAVIGTAVAAAGERIQTSRSAAFGTAMVGGGAAVVYLAVWAGAGPFGLFPPTLGLTGLALVAALVTASGLRSDTQYLAALAAVGAFLAPLILPSAAGSGTVLLAYCTIVSGAAGGVAAVRGWRATFGVAAAGLFLLPVSLISPIPVPWLFVSVIVVAGTLAQLVCRTWEWKWLDRAVFSLAWLLVLLNAGRASGGEQWVVLFAVPLLVAPSFLWPLQERRGDSRREVEKLIRLAVSALAWAVVTVNVLPSVFDDVPFLALGAVAAPYLSVGLEGRRSAFHALAFGILAIGVSEQFSGLAMTASWAGLALVSSALTRPSGLAVARWTGAGLWTLAAVQLFTYDLSVRASLGPAFAGQWAGVLYLTVGTAGLLAGPLWGDPAAESRAKTELQFGLGRLPQLLWIGAGFTLLAGGTCEIAHFFAADGNAANILARDLTVSAYWLAFAAACIGWGFWREQRYVRWAGLGVSALAVLKVTFYDLTRLDALYRVASLILLALIALAAAYLYHRRGEGGD